MRLGFLTYGLDRPRRGIGRAVLELGEALARHPDCETVFLTPYREGPFTDPAFDHVHLAGARVLPGLVSLGALQIPAIARRRSLDLVHDPTGVSPFVLGRWAGPSRRIVTLYDTIAHHYPEGYTFGNNLLNRRWIPATLGNVDAVITVSRTSRDDLIRYYRLAPSKVHVVPLAAGARFRPLPETLVAAVVARYRLRQPFLLYVGSLEARKNVSTLLRAFDTLRTRFPELTLTVAGPAAWKHEGFTRTLRGLAARDAVQVLGVFDDVDLPALYGAAAAFCYPSLFEGFGLPVLEAMACGTPVVCSDIPVLTELTGGAAVMVDPRSEQALGDALARVLTDQALAGSLRRRGLARAADFSWGETAQQTVAVYRRVLEH